MPASEIPSTTPADRLRRFIAWLPVYLLVSFVLYVLSIGPLFWYWYDDYYVGASGEFARFYIPLQEMCRRFEPLAKFVNWYVSLWVP